MVEYKQLHRVLLLGEGNFSYTLARVKYFINQTPNLNSLSMVATSFDSKEELLLKYPES